MARRLIPGALVLLSLLVGGTATAANPYPPPATGSARVDPSRIRVGECAVFSGDGFAGGSRVTIDDNGAAAGVTRADAQGRFSKRLCYGADARRGRHVLTGTGTAPGSQPLSVSAVLIVEGVRQNAGGPSGSSGGAVSGADGGAPGSTTRPGGAARPGASVGVNEPGAVTDPGLAPEVNAGSPAAGDDLGLWRLGAGVLGLVLALITSWWLLLLARRRRKDEDEDAGEGDLPLSPSPA